MNIIIKVKQRGLLYTWNVLRTRFPLKIVTRKSIAKAHSTWRLYHKFTRKYHTILNGEETIRQEVAQDRSAQSFRIWVLWLQGEQEAPVLVRRCISQMRKFYGNRVVVLDENNVADYVSMPDTIREKYIQGNISCAHYSDIIRVMLLCKHGGVWIDATVLLTEPLPDEIFNSKLFVFQMPKHYPGAIKISNWFILAEKDSAILTLVKQLLIEYWNTHNHIEYYFLFHIFFSIAANANDATKKEWKNMPYYSNGNPHLLKREMLRIYDVQRFNTFKRLSTIHKLSWKVKSTNPDTFFLKIIDGTALG